MQQNIVNAKLLEAAVRRDGDLLGLCLQKGADINAKDASGRNALMLAILNYPGSPDWAQYVISKGIDLFASDVNAKTAFTYAEEVMDWESRKKMVGLLLKSLPDQKFESQKKETANLTETDREITIPAPLKLVPKKKPGGGKSLIL